MNRKRRRQLRWIRRIFFESVAAFQRKEGFRLIHIGGRTFELIQEHKNGYNYEAFRERYSDVLDRYDYIVGDWGYSQLRLRGFFKEGHQKANKESSLSFLQDYLNEYCNFGCAYFILEKVANKAGQAPSAAAEAEEEAATPAPVVPAMPHNRWRMKEREPKVREGQGKDTEAAPVERSGGQARAGGGAGREQGNREGQRGGQGQRRDGDSRGRSQGPRDRNSAEHAVREVQTRSTEQRHANRPARHAEGGGQPHRSPERGRQRDRAREQEHEQRAYDRVGGDRPLERGGERGAERSGERQHGKPNERPHGRGGREHRHRGSAGHGERGHGERGQREPASPREAGASGGHEGRGKPDAKTNDPAS
jgi:uncharacterized protein YutD